MNIAPRAFIFWRFKIQKILKYFDTPLPLELFDFKNPFAKFYKNLPRTCKELAPHFN
jgi:hypothetical protein